MAFDFSTGNMIQSGQLALDPSPHIPPPAYCGRGEISGLGSTVDRFEAHIFGQPMPNGTDDVGLAEVLTLRLA